MLKGVNKVNIICDDLTRPTPISLILPPVLEQILSAGVKKENIKIIMALGSHRYMTDEEMKECVGEAVYSQYRVYNSEFKRKEDLADLSATADGTRVWASKIALDSDFRIGIGNIVPHPTLGFGGGAKILYPGITGEETVTKFHMMENFVAGRRFGVVENPIRHTVESWADQIGLHFIINTILTKEFEIYRVVAGHYIAAHRKGVEFAQEVFGSPMEQLADAVVVSSHPADKDYWQSGKAITASEGAIKPHGTVIHVSPNYEGVGPHAERLKYAGLEDPLAKLKVVLDGKEETDDLMALSSGVTTKARAERIELITVTDGMTKKDIEGLKTVLYSSARLQQAIDDVIAAHPDYKFAVITHGAEVLPYVVQMRGK